MWHPGLYGCTTKWTSGTLSSNDAATVNLGALFTEGIVVGFEIHNTHATGDLYWEGEGGTATTSDGLIEAGESSGFIPANDKNLSLLRETDVAVTYKIMAIGR